MDKCLWCGGFLNGNLSLHFILSFKRYEISYLCRHCQNLFEIPTSEKNCPVCNRVQRNSDVCVDCEKWENSQFPVVNNHSFYPYEGIIKEYIDRYKFQGDYQLRHIFVNLMKKQLPQDCVIVPIPISAETMQKRHFNQVVGWLDLKFTPALMAKPKAKAQFEKNRLERLLTRQPFEIDTKYSTQIEAKNICLVDDIYTTGATVHHAAQLLKSAGAKTVRSITLAR